MWMMPEVTVAPVGDVIDLAAVKQFLRVSTDAEDSDIAALAADACAQIEKFSGVRFLTQTMVLRARSFADLEHFPVGPVSGITAISYSDPLGASHTLDPAAYERFGADLEQGVRCAVGSRWPSTRAVADAVRVTAVVGYGAGANVPAPLRRAALLLIGDWYENREDTIAERSVTPQTIPNGVAAILANFTV